jgi:hypothetical protein
MPSSNTLDSPPTLRGNPPAERTKIPPRNSLVVNLENKLVSGAARCDFARGWRDHRGHFANHGQDQALVAVGERGTVFFNFRKETDFVFGKFAQHFLSVAIAGRFRAGEKVGQRNFHGLCDLGESFEGRHGMAVLNAGKVAAQKSGAPLDIALRKSSLSPITANNFPDIYFWFLFWHGFHTFLTRRYLTQCGKSAQEVSLFRRRIRFFPRNRTLQL